MRSGPVQKPGDPQLASHSSRLNLLNKQSGNSFHATHSQLCVQRGLMSHGSHNSKELYTRFPQGDPGLPGREWSLERQFFNSKEDSLRCTWRKVKLCMPTIIQWVVFISKLFPFFSRTDMVRRWHIWNTCFWTSTKMTASPFDSSPVR